MLHEVQKRLIELMLELKSSMKKGIESIEVIENGNYGYVIVLTSFASDLEEELLKHKLSALNGVQVMPDLWLFGPFIKEKRDTACEAEQPQQEAKIREGGQKT